MAERLPLPHAMMGANGCFVESVAILEHWQEAKGGNARARLLQSGAKADGETVAGHAVSVCEVQGALWCWDINFGWSKLTLDPTQREMPNWSRHPYCRSIPRSPRSTPYSVLIFRSRLFLSRLLLHLRSRIRHGAVSRARWHRKFAADPGIAPANVPGATGLTKR